MTETSTEAANVNRLRAELAAQEDKSVQALLLHECAVIAEAKGEEPAAARDYLAAFNADPQFREPLEALVRILSKRKSVKNLGKLLDAMVRAAGTPEEKARALYERASFVMTFEQNAEQAKELLEEAVASQPEDPLLWLELELLAAKEGDPAGRMRALEARAELATDTTWKALLFLELAELAAKAGDAARAYELIGTAAALEGKARFRTMLLLEHVAAKEDNLETLARALEGQADLLEEAIDDPDRGEAMGVPRYMRKPEHAADAWLRTAEAKRRIGDATGANAAVDRAATRLPGSAVLARARLVALEAAGDAAGAAEIAKSELDKGATGWTTASLWLRLAEAAALAADRGGALAALRKALEADPESIPARALEIDLLGDGQDPAGLAASLEATAECFKSDAAKSRAFALAAYVYGALADDVPSAKTALSQAAACGLQPGTVSRIARMIAALKGDAAWYDESTKRLLAAGAEPSEQAGLWLELGRSRLLRGDENGALEAFGRLGGGDEPGPSAWLGRALAAYAVGIKSPGGARDGDSNGEDGAAKARSAEAIEALAKVESDPEVARGLLLVAALRSVRAGDFGKARERLAELHRQASDDAIAAVFLAELARKAGDAAAAASALASCAAATEDKDLSAALHFESAFISWRAGDKNKAIEELEAARGVAPKAGATLLDWALRGASGDSVEGRRRALELAADAGGDAALVGLERFGLEAGPGGDAAEALTALEGVEQIATGDLAIAAALARLLYPDALAQRGEVDHALASIEALGGDAAGLARADRYRLAYRVDQDRAAAVERAASWAEADPKLYAALEWIGAAVAAEDREQEAQARSAAAAHFNGSARAALEASAAIVALLDQPSGAHHFIQREEVEASLVNLELAPPGCDPRRRSAALQGLGGALGNDAQVDAIALAAWSDLAAGSYEDARKLFKAVLELRPRDVASWEGVRSAAEALGDHVDQALSCAQLGALCANPDRGADFWERCGVILLEHTDARDDAEIAFERAFERNPKRAVAFDKLFRAVRSRNEDKRLLEIIAKRLEVSENDAEIGKLYWERARVMRKLGDLDAALAALENVTMLEPDHVGALALSGEICITKQAFAEAAPFLARLAVIEEAPKQQRLMSGIAAVDLFENKLGKPEKALEVLVSLHKAGLSNANVRERLAKVAARSGAWSEATAILDTLMNERATPEGRVEAARLGMAIWRHNLNEPMKAQASAAKLLEESPDDAEAVDFVLETGFDAGFRTKVLGRAKASLLQALAKNPVDAERIALLSRIAGAEKDAALRQATLGASIAVGKGGKEAENELKTLDGRAAGRPQIVLDDRALAEVADPEDRGPIPELFQQVAETVALALGPSLSSLGVTKKEKVDTRGGHPMRLALAEWVGAFGIATDWDLYIGGPEPKGVTGIPGEVPSLVVGAQVATPFDAATRSAIAREVFALRRGISALRTRDENTIASVVAAACVEAGINVQAPPYAVYNEVARGIHKEISRRVKKAIAEPAQRVAQEGRDARAWAAAARRSLDRVAVIAAGDASIVLAGILNQPRGELGAAIKDSERARRLLSFVLSPSYLELRKKLGMGVR